MENVSHFHLMENNLISLVNECTKLKVFYVYHAIKTIYIFIKKKRSLLQYDISMYKRRKIILCIVLPLIHMHVEN